ncbi:Nitrogen regulation protein NR(I) [bacterium HR39]|nr:Nitrogen regulation protein NR(I) [bacterium HR39]
MSAKDILIVDDELAIREVVGEILEDEGYAVRHAANSREAVAEIERREPALVLLDIWLEGSELDGIQILDWIRAHHPDVPVVMFSGHGTIETAVAAIRKGAYDFIEKPFKADRLLLAVQHALEAARLRRENRELRARQDEEEVVLVGSSPAMVKLRQTIERVAPTNARVLVSGPPGSGKEVVARLVHAKSRRAHGPFVVVNAALLDPERVDAVLFGVESREGTPRQIGVFERADGGTLLIDEIGDMPLETQGRILRALQEQRFTRIGGDRPVEVDVRVLATTSRDLKAEIARGRFREALYYRVAVVPVEVPPLSERREDIPELVRHFVTRAARRLGVPPRPFSDEALAVLQAADWPGDVRQLENAVEWALIMAQGEPGTPIRPEDLPPDLGHGTLAAMDPAANGALLALPLREAREEFERAYLRAQLQRFGGNVSRTAQFVGMERSALHRKLKALGLHDGAEPVPERSEAR